MPKYIAATPILHDGTTYQTGAIMELTEAQAQALLKRGRIVTAKVLPEDEAPPEPLAQPEPESEGLPQSEPEEPEEPEEPKQDEEQGLTHAQVMLAMLASDPDQARTDLWTKAAKPELTALNPLLTDAGLEPLKAADRDRIWAEIQP